MFSLVHEFHKKRQYPPNLTEFDKQMERWSRFYYKKEFDILTSNLPHSFIHNFYFNLIETIRQQFGKSLDWVLKLLRTDYTRYHYLKTFKTLKTPSIKFMMEQLNFLRKTTWLKGLFTYDQICDWLEDLIEDDVLRQRCIELLK